ncbi:MAG TPA: hypothetical protein VJH95_04515 [Candidatus Nanoarchaeia archaeon]|nr:hypothetical protein [Candidatus Nanoarchaeia archaeon]
MPKLVSKDIPLAEITLRKYEKPQTGNSRELMKKLCLSIGLLQPGDSRDVIVDILHVMVHSNQPLTSKEVEGLVISLRKKNKLPLKGIASSNIRRQLKRLKDIFLIESQQNTYRINENDSLENIFEEKIKQYYLNSILDRVKDYFTAIKQKK